MASTSLLSYRSENSILSINSRGSILSIGSVGSFLSIGSIGSAFSAFSIGSIGSFAAVLCALSDRSLMSFRGRKAILVAPDVDRSAS